jgi:CHAT domain-containing protein
MPFALRTTPRPLAQSTFACRLARAAVPIALLALLSCGGGPAAPPVFTDRSHTLEDELAKLSEGGGVSMALRRSELLRALGRQDEALASLERAADSARQALDWAALVALSREMGDVYLEQGRPQQALEVYGQRLKTAAALKEQVERARALVDTGYAFSLMGSMSRADEALGEAQVLAGDELGSDPLTAERCALAKERLNDADAALLLLQKAAQAYRGSGDRTGHVRAEVYRAGLLMRRTGSRDVLDQVEPLTAELADVEPRARLRRYQAEASFGQRRYSDCETEAEEAVRLSDRRGLRTIAKLSRVLLARCASENGHVERAIRSAEEAGFIAEEQRQNLTGDQARQEAGFEAFQIYRLLLSLQVRLPAGERARAVFATMERARARAHLDAVMFSRLRSVGPTSESSRLLERNREAAEEQVRRITQELTQRRAEPGVAERHRNALWALEDIKEAIRQENPLLSRIHVPEPATFKEVRDLMIDKDTLLVAYFVAEEQVVAVTVDATTEELFVLKSAPDVLGRAVRAYRRDMLLRPSRDLAEVREAGARLYRELMGPIDAAVKSHRHLLFIPHGELASLPFEALVDGAGKFLVEGHDVSYGLSATLAVALAKEHRGEGQSAPGTARRGFVGMGDPVYDWEAFKAARPEGSAPLSSRGLSLWIDAAKLAGDTGSTKPGAPLLERLPGTGAELRAISRLFGQDQRLYLRDQAAEEVVKKGAFENARIVHIASHGILEPHYQALALSLNPASGEDGFLLHSEIVDLKLNADLVVLSACQTGNTRLRSGEPIAGLALALRSAGAQRVVVSLWSVDDDATATLMTHFYGPLVKEGAGYAVALSDAKRKMLAKGPAHPYFWAPFVLLGR